MPQEDDKGSGLHPSLLAAHDVNKSVQPSEIGKAIKTTFVILLAALSSKKGWVP